MIRSLARFSALALLATAFPAGTTRASAVQSYYYTTSAAVAGGLDPVTTTISLIPESGVGMLTTPGTVALGTFNTAPLPPGATVTYDNTPFTINLNLGQTSPSSGSGPYYPISNFTSSYVYTINGVINGSEMGDGTSSLMPTITSITGSGSIPPFDPSALTFNLQGIAAPNGRYYGSTTLTATVDVTGTILPAPAPEPTSVAIFAAALAGFAWSRRTRITRSRSCPTTSA